MPSRKNASLTSINNQKINQKCSTCKWKRWFPRSSNLLMWLLKRKGARPFMLLDYQKVVRSICRSSLYHLSTSHSVPLYNKLILQKWIIIRFISSPLINNLRKTNWWRIKWWYLNQMRRRARPRVVIAPAIIWIRVMIEMLTRSLIRQCSSYWFLNRNHRPNCRWLIMKTYGVEILLQDSKLSS